VESGYFIQVSLLPDLNKMMLKDGDPLSAVIPIAENCPEYCLIKFNLSRSQKAEYARLNSSLLFIKMPYHHAKH
jgi:hypothetical protein